MIPRVQTARSARCPGDLRLVGRRSRGAPGRGRGGAASCAAEPGPAGAPPPGAPPALRRFSFARNPLKSLKTRKFKFSWIFRRSRDFSDAGGAGAARLALAPRSGVPRAPPACFAPRPGRRPAGPAKFWFPRSRVEIAQNAEI